MTSLLVDPLCSDRRIFPPQSLLTSAIAIDARSQAVQQSSFDDLPPALHLSILLFLPLRDRIHSCLVSRRWAALLGEPTFWSLLDFAGSRRLDLLVDDAILELCKRSAGCLRSLDLSAFGCLCGDNGEEEQEQDQPASFLPLLERMAAEGLTAKLESLRTFDAEAHGRVGSMGRLVLRNAKDAQRLRAACPALRSTSVRFRGGWQDVAAALRVLSCAGGSSAVRIAAHLSPRRLPRVPGRDHASEAVMAAITGGFVPFATALSQALQCCSVASLDLGSVYDDTTRHDRLCGYWDNFFGADALLACAGDPAAAVAAAEQLAGILASREHGPRRIKLLSTPPMPPFPVGGPDVTPTVVSRLLFGALKPESPLRTLSATGKVDRESVEALAAALQPGRAPQIERLEMAEWQLMDARFVTPSLFQR